MEKYREAIESIKAKYGNWFRLGRTFRTRDNFYFLDSGTGKVFLVSENLFRVLDCLFKTNNFDNIYKIDLASTDLNNALEELCDAISNYHLFSAPILTKDNICGTHFDLEKLLSHELTSLTLELTEQCNLRCKYCLYGETNNDYRSFGDGEMTFDTARKAVDFLMSHSPNNKKIYIGFYGGEPLIKFPLIKDVIQYVHDIYSERDVGYSMTSNMTLMDEEKAKFFAGVDKMSVVVSMDGPEDIHNSNRVFRDGTGSFIAAIKGLDIYLNARKSAGIENDVPILVSAVLDTPYTAEKFSSMEVFFKDLQNHYSVPFSILLSYVSGTCEHEDYIEINNRPENQWKSDTYFHQEYDPLINWTFNNLKEDNFSYDYFRRGALLEIHKRNISDFPISTYGLNGCCVPGSRRLYVTTKGDFLPCERIGTQTPIGNVNDGFNQATIRQHYVEDYVEEEIKYCGECWAVNICTNCYMDCFGDGHIDFSYRHRLCRQTRARISESLSIYHEVMENRPELIVALNKILIE